MHVQQRMQLEEGSNNMKGTSQSTSTTRKRKKGACSRSRKKPTMTDTHHDRLISNARKCGLRLRNEVAGDGNCFFRVLADQLKRIGRFDTNHDDLRAGLCDYMQDNEIEEMRHYVTEEYISNMRKDGTWAGEPEIVATTKKYGVSVQVVTSAEESTANGFYVHEFKHAGSDQTLYFGHLHESHYVSLEPDPEGGKDGPTHPVTRNSSATSTPVTPSQGSRDPSSSESKRVNKQSTLHSFFRAPTSSNRSSEKDHQTTAAPSSSPTTSRGSLPISITGTNLGQSSSEMERSHDEASARFDSTPSVSPRIASVGEVTDMDSDLPEPPPIVPASATSYERTSGEDMIPDEPYQPKNTDCLPVQQLGNRILKFQATWFQKFSWLHVDPGLGRVLCFVCVQASKRGLLGMAKCREDAFISSGLKNWKKAIEKCQKHEKSDAHRISVTSLKSRKDCDGVNAQLNKHLRQNQLIAQEALLTIMSSLQFLAQQGLAIRGKEASEGNFQALLQLRASDNAALRSFLKRTTCFTSHGDQNEMLKMMKDSIVSGISNEARASGSYGVIIDGTQDCTGREQESICIRFADENLDIREEFLGVYETPTTTGISLCNMLQDVLTGLNLPFENLRAQTYDGASNMAGKYRGCQAEVKKIQPLAAYTHCGAHISHLVASKAVQSAPFIRDALDNLQELGKLYKGSGKFKHLYLNLHEELGGQNPGSLKPVCPTRWLTRSASISAFLDNYEDVMEALETAASEFGNNVASRATCLRKCLSSGKCLLGLRAVLPIIQCLESFNRALQGTGVNVSGMLESSRLVRDELSRLRSEEVFSAIYAEVQRDAVRLHLEPLETQRMPTGHRGLPAHTTEERYRRDYYKVLDNASTSMLDYFSTTDLEEYGRLAAMLLTGQFQQDLVDRYPELSDSLKLNLAFFHSQFKAPSVEEYRQIFRSMDPVVRRMFGEVEALLRLLLVSPASSTEAERSFSALRRLKTWLRSTMTQRRLNDVMVCHIHRRRLEKLDMGELAKQFASRSGIRINTFGRFA